jgi:hypothetical protein
MGLGLQLRRTFGGTGLQTCGSDGATGGWNANEHSRISFRSRRKPSRHRRGAVGTISLSRRQRYIRILHQRLQWGPVAADDCCTLLLHFPLSPDNRIHDQRQRATVYCAGLQFPLRPQKGTGFEQPLQPHQHWHVDVSYINLSGTFYYLYSCFVAPKFGPGKQ